MTHRRTHEIAAPPENVFAYLANPRHVVIANHKGPIIEQSEGEQREGSWYVLALDQLRAHVQYTAFDRPREIATRVTWSGRGSGGATTETRWTLTPVAEGRRTRLDVVGTGRGGLIRFGPVVRVFSWLYARRVVRAIERGE